MNLGVFKQLCCRHGAYENVKQFDAGEIELCIGRFPKLYVSKEKLL